GHVTEQLGGRVAQVSARHHRVDHAVLEQELGRLESGREVLPDRLLDHARPGPRPLASHTTRTRHPWWDWSGSRRTGLAPRVGARFPPTSWPSASGTG